LHGNDVAQDTIAHLLHRGLTAQATALGLDAAAKLRRPALPGIGATPYWRGRFWDFLGRTD
jgi:uncharacterized membrane protein (DUF2068 family)